jgi:hypothetical protein
MTAEEFWQALEETATIPGRRFRLRGRYWRREGDGLCPICALCLDCTGDLYDNASYPEAARRLGLSTMFAHEVAQAADGRPYERDSLKDLTAVRERLENIFAREDQERD